MTQTKIPSLKYINSEQDIYNYMAFHNVEFNLEEFYENSKDSLMKENLPHESFESHRKINLRQLVNFNFTYKPKPKRVSKASRVSPYADMTLGLPEY